MIHVIKLILLMSEDWTVIHVIKLIILMSED